MYPQDMDLKHNPVAAKNPGEVMEAIDNWEGIEREYYRCGGPMIDEMTRVVIVMKILPPQTPAHLKLSLRKITEYEDLKDEVRANIRFLEDHGGLKSAGAHVVEDPSSREPDQLSAVERDDIDESDIPAFALASLTASQKDDLILALNHNKNMKRKFGQRPRPQAPPRDERDMKCGNCGMKGHTAQNCRKPRIPIEERKCHNCGEPGHIAKKCPAPPKKGNQRANVAEEHRQTLQLMDAPRIFMVADDDGFRTQRKARSAVKIGDIKVSQRVRQGERKRNQFHPLQEEAFPLSLEEL